MSATRDKTQKVTFVYSNLYSIYRQGVERAREGATQDLGVNSASDRAHSSLAVEALGHLVLGRELGAKRSEALTGSGAVLKAGTATAQVTSYTPAQLVGRKVTKPAVLKKASEVETASPVESLKQNLQQLNDLQARLRFMLKELEELIKE